MYHNFLNKAEVKHLLTLASVQVRSKGWKRGSADSREGWQSQRGLRGARGWRAHGWQLYVICMLCARRAEGDRFDVRLRDCRPQGPGAACRHQPGWHL